MIRRGLLVVAVLVAAWLVLCAVLFVRPSTGRAPGKADAVVVLAGGLNSRLDPAIALMQRRIAPVLAISSAFHGPNWKKAQQLCRGDLGPTRYEVLCFTAKPYSTQGEARAIAELAHDDGWKRVVVVTSAYHVTRARMLIRRCYHGQLSMVATHSPWWSQPQHWVDETGKLLVQLTFRRGC
jgi:uncharacterized SAM-binding protein YcdF (DUF218 family)